MESKENEKENTTQVMLRTQVNAEFVFSDEPSNSIEKEARRLLNENLDAATKALQGPIRSLIVEFINLQQQMKQASENTLQ